MLSENIFSQHNIYKLSYYHYIPPRNSRSADRRDWGTAGMYTQRCIAPLGTDALGIALHRQQAPCHGKSGCEISRRSLSLSPSHVTATRGGGNTSLRLVIQTFLHFFFFSSPFFFSFPFSFLLLSSFSSFFSFFFDGTTVQCGPSRP